MTAPIESAWPTHPDYRIDLVPCSQRGQVWADKLLLAETAEGIVVKETDHVHRLYFPERDVRWEYFEPTDHHTICPFKGRADYWSLTLPDIGEGTVDWAHRLEVATVSLSENVVWTYRDPFPEVAGLKGFVCFYHERLRVVLNETWPDGSVVATRFPPWGDAAELVRLMDVEPVGELRFVGPAHGHAERDVVEGGQILGEAVVAASKAVPAQRVTSISVIFSKAASFSKPLDLDVEILRAGRSFSTVEVRISQDASLRSTGLVLMDAGTPDLIRHAPSMPDVVGPNEAVPYVDFGVSGRELRVVDAAYDHDPNRVGPPEIYVWARFRDAPAEPYLHAALLAQSATHWTIGAAMLPHPGIGEADAHVTLSTGIIQTTFNFHDDVDVTEWLLYANPAIWAGRGQAQGQGHVFTCDGSLVASYSVQAMIRGFDQQQAFIGKDHRTAM
jgi:acyl-CoA thioesterase II